MDTSNFRVDAKNEMKTDPRAAKVAPQTVRAERSPNDRERNQAELDEIAADMDRFASFPCTD